MATLLLLDFDRLTPAQLQQFGVVEFVGSGIVSTTGRTDLGVTGTTGATQAQNTIRTLPLNPSTSGGYQGFALKPTSLPASEQKVWAAVTATNTPLLTLTITPTGTVKCYAGSFETGTLLGTSGTAFVSAGAWSYLQIGHDTGAGNTFQVRSTDTTPATIFVVFTPDLVSAAPWAKTEYYLTDALILDDAYVLDADPHGPSYFLGDTALEVYDLAADTAPAVHTYIDPWRPDSGTDLSARITDDPCDLDGSYNYTRQSYSRILYVLDTVTDDGSDVSEVAVVGVMRIVSSSFAPVPQLLAGLWDGIEVIAGEAILTPPTTAYGARIGYTRQSIGPNDWTVARVNASQFGLRS